MERAPSGVGAGGGVSTAVSRAAKQVLGQDPAVVGAAYWMDMALTNAAGIPTVAFGPAGGGEHADVEWVDIASVEKCIDVYLRSAEILCS